MFEPRSIRYRLLISVLTGFIIIWLIITILTYNSSSHESEEIYDAALASYARVIASLIVHEVEEEKALEINFQRLIEELGTDVVTKSTVLSNLQKKLKSPSNNDYMNLDLTDGIKGHSYESQFAFIVRSFSGKVLLRSHDRLFKTEFRHGFFNIKVNNQSWRVFGLSLNESDLHILVGENLEVRNELQNLIIFNHLLPFFILLPILAIVIWLAIKRGLQPLDRVTEKIAKRNPRSLTVIELDGVPEEILPLINELNSLFLRIDKVLENERRFTANAAHELRTPLAALKTHAQVLELNTNKKTLESVRHMIASIDRASHVVEQLLTLSKAEANLNKGISFKSVDLVAITQNQLSEQAALAIDKGITPVFKSELDHCLIQGDETLLYILVRNLIENAIQYTDNGGELNVIIEDMIDNVRLSIIDDGPGISEENLELMTQRFQRGDHPEKNGAGLGLFIVKQIVNSFNANLLFLNKSPHGLIVRIEFSKTK
jgi:two-component system sensor histidine kinase QseC